MTTSLRMRFHASVRSVDLDTREVSLRISASEHGLTDERMRRLVDFLRNGEEVLLDIPVLPLGEGGSW